MIQCALGPGVGQNLPVVLRAGGSQVYTYPYVTLSYGPPAISSLSGERRSSTSSII